MLGKRRVQGFETFTHYIQIVSYNCQTRLWMQLTAKTTLVEPESYYFSDLRCYPSGWE